MKHLGTILGAIAIVGVVYIGFLKEGGEPKKATVSEVVTDPSKGVRLAYVRTDSLEKNYKYYVELSEQLQQEEAKIQKQIEAKQRDFQIELNLYQQEAPKMSPEQRQASEADLMRVQQQYEMWAREQSETLLVKQQELQTNMKSDMDSVLFKMKDELLLDFILLYDENSALIFANEDYDITNVVVERLNENYGKKETVENEE